MTSQKTLKRTINGVLLLNKPSGMSSNHALQKVKRLYQAKKAGHTGSLDPLATGMLPICFGIGTKLSQYLLDADKRYRVIAKLGQRTTTSDAEGEIVAEKPVPEFSADEIESVLKDYRGGISQIPSMFSALKYQGQPLYKLARQGITVERAARDITIYELQLIRIENDELELEVHCSKGTYIRTLVDDIGEQLGCGAHVQMLHRSAVSGFDSADMINWDTLEAMPQEHLDHCIMPVNKMVAHFPRISIASSAGFYLQNGQDIKAPEGATPGLVQLFCGEQFLGLGEVSASNRIVPRKMIH